MNIFGNQSITSFFVLYVLHILASTLFNES